MKYALNWRRRCCWRQLPATPALGATGLSKTPAIARSSTRMQIVKTSGRANPYTDGGYYRNGWQNDNAPQANGMSNVTIRARRG